VAYSQQTIAEFLDAVGARTPAPAAGSATAVAAALAAALVELAANVSGDEAGAAAARALRGGLLTLADEDASAFAAFLDSGSQRSRSRTIDVPLAIAETAAEIAALAGRVAADGKRAVHGDAQAAAELARAAVLAATRLVRINIGEEQDERGVRADELAREARRGVAGPA
jgi:methenyltetrahydrofolate cyclohydrolase